MVKAKKGGAGVPHHLFICFGSVAAFFSRLWASESHPTSRLTFGKPRSRKRRNPRLLHL